MRVRDLSVALVAGLLTSPEWSLPRIRTPPALQGTSPWRWSPGCSHRRSGLFRAFGHRRRSKGPLRGIGSQAAHIAGVVFSTHSDTAGAPRDLSVALVASFWVPQ